MKIGIFDIPIEKEKIYSSLELATMILSLDNGLAFLDLCKDFNSFNWNLELLYGYIYSKENHIFVKLDEDCIESLIEMRDEHLKEENVYRFVEDLENTPIDVLNEQNEILTKPENQDNIDIYLIFKNGGFNILALFAKTQNEKFLNRATIYADMLEFCGVRSYESLEIFIKSIINNYQIFFDTDENPFIVEFGEDV